MSNHELLSIIVLVVVLGLTVLAATIAIIARKG